MSHARRVVAGQMVKVTRRTPRRRFLLRPDSKINQLYIYLVAVFALKFHMLVCAINVLSDHHHIDLVDTRGLLPHFMRELHRVLALCIKCVRKWDGSVWDNNGPSVVEILTPQAAAQEMVYTWLNAVRAGLVRDPQDWPGVTSRLEDLDGPAITVQRPDVYLNPKNPQWPKQIELKLHMPPILAELGLERARQMLRDELARQLGEARAEVRANGWKVLGPARCSNVSPLKRASSWEPLRSRNPVLAAGRGLIEARKQAIAMLQQFRQAYRKALARWRNGFRDVLFPIGTWAMVQYHGAKTDPPALAT